MLCVLNAVSTVGTVWDLTAVSHVSPLNVVSAEIAVSFVKFNNTPGHLHPAGHIKVLPEASQLFLLSSEIWKTNVAVGERTWNKVKYI